MSRGKYIVLEGPEGVGKTTQLQELARRLQAAGLPVRTLREPDSQSDLTARAIRSLTQDPRYPMNTNTEVLLYNAARSQSLQVIRQSVEQGIICLVDRNYLTTLAIQYYGRGDIPDYETINRIISFAVNGVEPDLTIVLDAPVPVLKERLSGRYHGERFDNLDAAFLERVRAGYLWEAKQRNLPVVYATDDPAAVTDAIWKLVTEALALRSSQAASAQPASLHDLLKDKQFPVADTIEPPLVIDTPSVAQEAAGEPGPAAGQEPSTPGEYFMPRELDEDSAQQYRQAVDTILDKRRELLDTLEAGGMKTDSIARAVLPVASLAGSEANEHLFGLHGSGSSQLAALSQEVLQATHGQADAKAAILANYWPRNELSAVSRILYPHADMTLRELTEATDQWPYEQRARVLQTYAYDGEYGDLAGIGYEFDVLTDCATWLVLQEAGMQVQHQYISPRYGYDVPEEVVETGLADAFDALFDASLELHSRLQAAGNALAAQLVVLGGHKVRLLLTLSAPDLLRLQSIPAAAQLAAKLRELAGEVHPVLMAPQQAARTAA